MAKPGQFVPEYIVTANDMNALPGGVLGYAQTTSSQAGIGSTLTDLTGLSVTVDVLANRRIRITGHCRVRQRTSAAISNAQVREGSTSLGIFGEHTLQVDERDAWGGAVVVTPSAGSHTYKLSVTTNAGTIDVDASSTHIAYILVEDLGPV